MNSFEKKQWIRIVLCTLAVAALALVLTGILGGGDTTYRQLTEEEKAAAELAAAPGAYTAEKETNFSTIQVLVNTEDGKITDCKITSAAKTEGSDFLTDEIRDAWAKSIVENQSAENDVISSATLQFSAGAVKEAVAEIQAQMNGGEKTGAEEQTGETAAEEKAEETKTEEGKAEETKTEETKTEETKTDTAETKSGDDSSQALYGSYLSEKETNFSTIRVIVSTKNGEIVKCRIQSEAKSEGSDFLTDEIKEAWAKAIVESQGAENDAISGATLTFSAGAVKEAVAEIQAQMAGGAAAAEVKTEEKTEETKTEEKAEETKSETAETKSGDDSAQALYGSYLAEKETNFSTIRVIVSTKNGEIVKCRIQSEAKSEGSDFLTDEIKDAWAKAIVESQGAENDAISGATLTFSAGAVKEALAEIQARMNGEELPAAAETTDATSGATQTEDATSGATQTEDATSGATQKAEEKTEEEPVAEEKPADETAAQSEEPEKEPALFAGYRVTKETNFSTITVIVTAEKGKITGCRILSEAKSEGSDFLTDEIKDAWAKAIVESQSAENDAISGATVQFSAGAVKEAVAEILGKIR